jgi:hypothetical protein
MKKKNQMTHGMLAGMKTQEWAVQVTYPWLGNPHLLTQDCGIHDVLLKHLNHPSQAGKTVLSDLFNDPQLIRQSLCLSFNDHGEQRSSTLYLFFIH